MKNLISLLLLFASLGISAQTNHESFLKEIKEFQDELNKNFQDSLKSPLKKESLETLWLWIFFLQMIPSALQLSLSGQPKKRLFQ